MKPANLVRALKGIAARVPGNLLVGLITLGTGTPLAWGQVAGPEVHDALKAGAWARVIIALQEPNASMDDRPRWNSEIGRVQSRVLASLTPSDFKPTHQWASVGALAGEVSQSGLTKLLANPDVVRVDLDTGGSGGLFISVPLIQGDQIHNLGYTGNGVVVAVLDSGLEQNHPDLRDALIEEACFCTRGGIGCCPDGTTRQFGLGSASDDVGHGTNVTGIIVSAGSVSWVGVAPGAKIVAIKVLDRDNLFEDSAQVVSALDWIINNRPDVQVINMSLGTSAMFDGICDNRTAFTMAFARAVNTLKNMGITIFASSGNDRSGTQMEAPACTANTIAVGAVYKANVGPVSCDSTTEADQVTCFTNSNSKLELMAPGAPIESIDCCNIGTSFASPHAAGGAALLLEANPTLTPDQIKAALMNSSVLVTDPKNALTFPRINLLDALNAVSTP